jgi:hypothetical protein
MVTTDSFLLQAYLWFTLLLLVFYIGRDIRELLRRAYVYRYPPVPTQDGGGPAAAG